MRERKREEKGGERGRRREEEETGMERQGKSQIFCFTF